MSRTTGNMMRPEEHWDEVYRTKHSAAVSWFQRSPEPSLKVLDRFVPGGGVSLIDVGGGASNLVDALLERGWTNLTVLDIAASALLVARDRLGNKGLSVRWEVADITRWQPAQTYDVWHDRAVFHFLTTPKDRAGYKQSLMAGTRPDSLIIIATFALGGPEKCSGLAVQRYNAETLSNELGSAFQLLDAWDETHVTPSGSEQAFNWCVFRRIW